MRSTSLKNYILAFLAATAVFVLIVAFYSNAGAASNDPFRFDVTKAAESLAFLFGWISGIPNTLALLLGLCVLLLPSYFVFKWVIKKLNRNEKIN
ncbi:MAG: hypothetical protein ACR2MT_06090 [Aurantibacter sp.]